MQQASIALRASAVRPHSSAKLARMSPAAMPGWVSCVAGQRLAFGRGALARPALMNFNAAAVVGAKLEGAEHGSQLARSAPARTFRVALLERRV